MNHYVQVFAAFISFTVFASLGQSESNIREIFVEKCEKNLPTGNNDPNQLCQMRKLQIGEATGASKEFGDCILKEFGYFDANGEISKKALVKDYHNHGVTNRDKELSDMLDDCKREFKSAINSVNYLLCITMDKDFATVMNSRIDKEGKWKPTKSVC